jgi:hypothetical protein
MRSSLTIHLLLFTAFPVREEKVFSSLHNTGEEHRKGGEHRPMTQLQQQLKTLAHWRGSEKTADAVREEISRRWGEAEAEKYDPLTNCFTSGSDIPQNSVSVLPHPGRKAVVVLPTAHHVRRGG